MLDLPDAGEGLTASQLVGMGVVDPIRLFVKDEPHSTSKIDSKRYRLIFLLSIIDNIIAKLLFSVQNMEEISSHRDLPSKPGLGLHDDGLEDIYGWAQAAPGPIASADISGWDWSMTAEDFDADLNRRVNLNNGHSSVWYKLAKVHYRCMKYKLLVTSDSIVYEQQTPGVMPSGWYNTSSTNSYVRTLDSYIVQYESGVLDPWAFSMGDDCLETLVEKTAADTGYTRRGKLLKMYVQEHPNEFEFCSHRFNNSPLGVPTNIPKLIKSFLHETPKNELDRRMRVSELQYNIRNLPKSTRDDILQIVVDSLWC